MINQRFRAIYLAAIVVMCIGLLGTVLVPKAHASAWKKSVPVASLAPTSSTSEVLEPTIQQRAFSSSKALFGFASLGLLSSAGLALLYSKSKA